MKVWEETIEIPPTPMFIPSQVGDGDVDFGGHGPRVDASAKLESRDWGKELWVRLDMHARETKKDYTEAQGTVHYHVWTVPSKEHQQILGILSDDYTEFGYVDTDHDDDRFAGGSNELVREFTFVGDTNGKEAGSRTGMKVEFNPITLRLLDTRPDA